jgi:glycosyltransferase involved in cell wall biosynthesis
MKIAVNTRFLIKDKLEGIGWFTYQTLKRITRQHPEHEFLFLFDRPYDNSFIFSDNITPIVVNPPARHPVLWYLWFEVALPRVFRKHQPDLFISPDGYLSLSADVDTLLVIHDLAFEHYPMYLPFFSRHYYRHFSERFAHRADQIATVSQFSKSDIMEQYGVPEDKIRVVYDGAHPAFQPIPEKEQHNIREELTEGAPYFVYVGALHPRKNIKHLLQAFEAFKKSTQSEVKLLIVGRAAWQTNDIERTYQSLECKEDVLFTGHITDIDRLNNVMASALSLVYVSKFEGFGLPVLEAMNCQTPVITSNCTSMAEIADGSALTADPFSVEAIKQQMVRVYKNPDLRDRLVKRGTERSQQFSWDKTAERLWTTAEDLLDKKVTAQTAASTT